MRRRNLATSLTSRETVMASPNVELAVLEFRFHSSINESESVGERRPEPEWYLGMTGRLTGAVDLMITRR
jgi:hypothetical protein